jgi:uncharacterized protein involved in response to NO
MNPKPAKAVRGQDDRSVLRNLRKAGDVSRDGRGRVAAMPPILQYGFRPFFLLAALHAGLAIPVWMWLFTTGASLPGVFQGVNWHVHEMFFGYLFGVIAGFILTAVPNWTGRLPLSGRPLAFLVTLWLLGRQACALVADPMLAMLADLAFPATLAFAIWREVVAGKNWRNAPVAAMLTLFGAASALHHLENFGLVESGTSFRVALAVIVMLVGLIGGRIVPSFTRNWLARQGSVLPQPFGRPDRVALAVSAAAVLLWVAVPELAATGVALAAAGLLHAFRLSRWAGWASWRNPILFILHVGYAWLALSLVLLGLAVLWPAVPQTAALHALTAGAVGTMTLAVMTRASLGHTGRAIVADRWIDAIYLAVTIGAVLRVAAPMAGSLYLPVLVCGGLFWSGAFLLFVIRYTPVLCGPRASAA